MGLLDGVVDVLKHDLVKVLVPVHALQILLELLQIRRKDEW